MKNNSGQSLLKKAKKIIPGGNQLLSKRSERFLPNLWPAYYKKAKGCKVWDLDDKTYFDFAGMGVTSCILGYADQDVNNAIKETIANGSMCTLNAPEEIELSQKLIKMHPWSQMAKFTRSGGEACNVAIRIARAYSKKDIILFCGYHGWHDWYMSANLATKSNLNDQLLPGLKSSGVPRSLSKTSIPFYYGDEEGFRKLLKKYKNRIAAVIMEPVRNYEANIEFLNFIRKSTKKSKIVLIFDEITSGFHDNYGGIHLKIKIDPDMAVFGKALGNGTPISAILGKKKIMQASQETFISSTMWTDRIGFKAAIASLDKMKKLKVQNKLVINGKLIKKKWSELAKKNSLHINVFGIDSMPGFSFNYKNSEKLITYFTQEMLKEGYLASANIAISLSHSKIIINKYLSACDKVFNKISILKNLNKKIPLKSSVRDLNFKRLN
ncbi:aminotransferase class III-fold pyridoxal phosphate-dependent enzyme [Alphaproteobacteria bacterium]|nr:aminotransferase class III-fold pyridoxal phosphate-dependent enzyme [Alphaproteobacteria bacterium]